jgi:rare lipoprotein A
MSVRLFATAGLALLLSLPSHTHAQSASAPAAAAEPAPAAAPAAKVAMSADASEGKVAYYGRKFAGRKTASGERFNPNALTMAHKTLPMGTMVRVTNLKNNKSVVVRVNDRGPSTADRIGDLSQAAAGKIKMLRSGVIDAKLEVVGAAKARKAKKVMKG